MSEFSHDSFLVNRDSTTGFETITANTRLLWMAQGWRLMAMAIHFMWIILLSSSAADAIGVTIPISQLKQLGPLEIKETLSKALS